MQLFPPYLLVLVFATTEKHGIVIEELRLDIDVSPSSKIHKGKKANGGANVNHHSTNSSTVSL